MRNHPPMTAGHLEVTSPAKLFVSAYARGLTGTLIFRRDRAEKRVLWHDGRIVGAASNLPSESLGTLLVCQGWIDVATYAQSLAKMDEGGRRHGEVLVELGVLPRERLAQALRMQALARLIDAGTWPHGTYTFEPGPPPIHGKPYPLWNVLQSGVLQKHGRAKLITLGRAREGAVCRMRESVFLSPLVALGDPLETLRRVDGAPTVGEIVRASDNQLATFVNLLLLRNLEVVAIAEKPKAAPAATGAERKSAAAAPRLAA